MLWVPNWCQWLILPYPCPASISKALHKNERKMSWLHLVKSSNESGIGRVKKSSLPMMPLFEIKVNSVSFKEGVVHNTKIVPTNPGKGQFKRNVHCTKYGRIRVSENLYSRIFYAVIWQMKSDVAKKSDNIPASNSSESHCFNVHAKYSPI